MGKVRGNFGRMNSSSEEWWKFGAMFFLILGLKSKLTVMRFFFPVDANIRNSFC